MIDYLRKLIIVSSVSDTGKTSSIKRAAQKLSIFEGYGTTEIRFAGLAYHRGRHFTVGLATQGDDPNAIENAVEFFNSVDLQIDVIIMACKSRGVSTDAAKEFARTSEIEPIWISTDWNEDISVNVEKTSDLILRAID